MNENFFFLFQYLEKENINIDKNEFLFQIQSHPDYPSLLAISDTLSFFNIENSALRLNFDELNLLPNYFAALLNMENGAPTIIFLEKKVNSFFYRDNKKQIEMSISELEKRWSTIVLLIERPEYEIKSIQGGFKIVLPVESFHYFEKLK